MSHVFGQYPKNSGGKIQTCLFCLKIGTNVVLEVLIPNPHLDFWNSDPKIYFWANFGQKSESCQFCSKIVTHSISRMIILIPRLVFWISNPKSISRQIWAKKSENCLFCLKIDTQSMVRMLNLILTLIFSISNPKSIFREIWAEKVKINMFMILFPPDCLQYCNFGNCVPYVVYMFCELVILFKKSQNCPFHLKIGRVSRG